MNNFTKVCLCWLNIEKLVGSMGKMLSSQYCPIDTHDVTSEELYLD